MNLGQKVKSSGKLNTTNSVW